MFILEHRYPAASWTKLIGRPYPSSPGGCCKQQKVSGKVTFRSDPPLVTFAIVLSKPYSQRLQWAKRCLFRTVLINLKACVKCGSCPAFRVYALFLYAWNVARLEGRRFHKHALGCSPNLYRLLVKCRVLHGWCLLFLPVCSFLSD
jgi:hypothetical protein